MKAQRTREATPSARIDPKVAETVTQDAIDTATWKQNVTPPPVVTRYKIIAGTDPDDAQTGTITREGTYWYSPESSAIPVALPPLGWNSKVLSHKIQAVQPQRSA